MYICAKARKHTFGKEVNLDMFKEKFGIEIEFTGITRNKASKIVAELVNGSITETRDYYDTKEIKASDGRKWKVMYDGSLRCQTKRNGEVISAGRDYSCELVSPILTYDEDIETLQEIVRALRKSGAFTNASCGIHIHLDGTDHDVRTIRNFINIIATTFYTRPLKSSKRGCGSARRWTSIWSPTSTRSILRHWPNSPIFGIKATTEAGTPIITTVDITSLTYIVSSLVTTRWSLGVSIANSTLGR